MRVDSNITSIASNIFPKGSNDKFQEFLKMNDKEQREAISDVRKHSLIFIER